MSRSLMQSLKETAAGLSRRDLFKSGSLLALPALLLGRQAAAAPAPVAAAEPAMALAPGGLEIGSNLYKSIGVRSFINGTGTLTVNSGSLELPEVQAAQEWASKHMVQLDELMEAVGARLATLTGAGTAATWTRGVLDSMNHTGYWATVSGGRVGTYWRNLSDASERRWGVRVFPLP